MAGIKIFISYRHNDAQEEVYHIHRYISGEFGTQLTMLDDNSLLPGDNFLHWIERSVQSADLILVMIGKKWITVQDATGRQKLSNPKDFVLLEIESAFKNKKKIVPIILPGASMPAKDQLPASIAQLADVKGFSIPDRSDEAAWRNQLHEIERTIQKEFPFYKSILFWVMTFTWPVVISIAAFFSGIVVTNLAGWLHITLPSLKNEFSYFIVTCMVWAAMYVVLSTRDYTSGTTGIIFLPFVPYRKIVSSLNGFFNTFIFGFPFNILFTRLVAEIIAWTFFHYFHSGFVLTFLLAYIAISIYLLYTFSMEYDYSDNGRRRHYLGNVSGSKSKYEHFFNLEELRKKEEKAKLSQKNKDMQRIPPQGGANKPGV